jgi:hypothetical protein
VILALKEYDLWELVDKAVVPWIDVASLEIHEKNEIKVERVILDSMNNHITPRLFEKKMAKYMFDSLVGLFQRTNMNRKMVLRKKTQFDEDL